MHNRPTGGWRVIAGQDVQAFIHMVKAHSEESRLLRVQIARLASLLTRSNVNWRLLACVRAGRLAVIRDLDSNKTRPIIVGELMMRMMSRIHHIIKVCGSLNVRVGAKAGGESLIHSFDRLYNARDECLDPDPNDPWVHALLDASNAFNSIEIEWALLDLRTKWPRGARYAFNCYRGAAPILWRDRLSVNSIWFNLKTGEG